MEDENEDIEILSQQQVMKKVEQSLQISTQKPFTQFSLIAKQMHSVCVNNPIYTYIVLILEVTQLVTFLLQASF